MILSECLGGTIFHGQKAGSRVVGDTLRPALLVECGLGALDARLLNPFA